jgi:hypothetical protein
MGPHCISDLIIMAKFSAIQVFLLYVREIVIPVVVIPGIAFAFTSSVVYVPIFIMVDGRRSGGIIWSILGGALAGTIPHFVLSWPPHVVDGIVTGAVAAMIHTCAANLHRWLALRAIKM